MTKFEEELARAKRVLVARLARIRTDLARDVLRSERDRRFVPRNDEKVVESERSVQFEIGIEDEWFARRESAAVGRIAGADQDGLRSGLNRNEMGKWQLHRETQTSATIPRRVSANSQARFESAMGRAVRRFA